MFRRVLVPLDGTKYAEQAIPVAARIARASGGSVVLMRVVLPPVELGKYAARHAAAWERTAYETERAKAISYLAGTMIYYASDLDGIDSDMGVASGIIPPTICSTARSEHADLIVMYSYGETGLKRWLFGSVTQEVARKAPVPMLILRGRGDVFPTSRADHPVQVMVTLDGSPLAETALLPAAQLTAALAAPAQGRLHLLRVLARPVTEGKEMSRVHIDAMHEAETYLRTVAERLRQSYPAICKLTITWSVVVNHDVVGAIIQRAENIEGMEQVSNCHLIAMATHGRRGIVRLMRGSVPEGVLGATRLPLLLVRPQEIASQTKKEGIPGGGGY